MKLAFLFLIWVASPSHAWWTSADSCGRHVNLAEIQPGRHLCATKAELDKETAQILAKRGIPDVRKHAVQELRKKGLWYDRERVEITGIHSADDTNERFPGMFDMQIHPSNLKQNVPKGESRWERFKRIPSGIAKFPYYYSKDFIDAVYDINGRLNERTKKELEPLKGKSVKEIVAHSWGTEIVYSAIQEGLIIPPKRLFVLGSPGKSDHRWRLLAERTGTTVIFVGDERDSVTNWGDKLRGKRYALQQEKLWQDACGQRACNPHQRAGEIQHMAMNSNGPGDHSREGYYDGMMNSQYPFAGGPVRKTAGEMRADDGEALKAASAEIFSSGLAEARESIIDGARAMARKKEETERAREQDAAINRLLADLAAKYCADPEMVDQDELDRVPKPSKDFFLWGRATEGECGRDLFLELARQIQTGRIDARGIRAKAAFYRLPPVSVVEPPSTPIPWVGKFLQAEEMKALVVRACGAPGSVTARELKDKFWLPEADGYTPEMGADLSGCARDFWFAIGRVRERHMQEVVGPGLEIFFNNVAQSILERRARQRDSGGSAPHAPPGAGGDAEQDRSVDFSKAEEWVRRLRR